MDYDGRRLEGLIGKLVSVLIDNYKYTRTWDDGRIRRYQRFSSENEKYRKSNAPTRDTVLRFN